MTNSNHSEAFLIGVRIVHCQNCKKTCENYCQECKSWNFRSSHVELNMKEPLYLDGANRWRNPAIPILIVCQTSDVSHEQATGYRLEAIDVIPKGGFDD